MKNGTILAVAGLLAGMALSYAWQRPVGAPTSNTHIASQSEATLQAVADLEDQLRALRADLAQLQHNQGESRQAANVAVQTGSTPVDASLYQADAWATDTGSTQTKPLDGAQEPPLTGRERRERVVKSMETRMMAEDQDPRWGTRVESELADGVQAAGLPGSDLVSVECRSSLCRLNLRHANAEAEDDFLGNIAGLPGTQDTELFYTRDEMADGSTDMVIYLARQGYSLGM